MERGTAQYEASIKWSVLRKKWNGNITKLKYNIPPQADYTYEECRVTFSDIQFKQ